MLSQQNRTALFTVLALSIFALDPAFAQSASGADWLAPAQSGVTAMTTTLVTLGGALMGLAIVAYGMWSAMTHKIEWAKLWTFIVAALIVTVGPAGILWLITKFQTSAS